MVDDNYSNQTKGLDICRFSTMGDAIDASEEKGIIFVKNGTYHKQLRVYESYYLIGENRSNTIIDAQNQGTVITFSESSSMISEFTIMNAGNHGESAGVDINDGYPYIVDNIIKNNEECGIKINGKMTIPSV